MKKSLPKVIASSAQRLQKDFWFCGYAPDIIRSSNSLIDAFSVKDNAAAVKILRSCKGSFWGWYSFKKSLWIFTDRWGSYPVYSAISLTGEKIFFSCFYEVLEQLDFTTTPYLLATYLTFGYVPGEDTLFKKIQLIPPGNLIEFSPKGEKKFEYFTFMTNGRMNIDPIEARYELDRRLQNAVANSLKGVDEILLPLSGGLDSRFLLAFILECLPADRIRAITYGFPGSFDYELSKKVAKSVGVKQHLCPLSISDYTIQEVNALAHDCGGQIFFIPQTILKGFEVPGSYNLPIIDAFPGDMLGGSHIWPEILNITNTLNYYKPVFEHHILIKPCDALACLNEKYMTVVDFKQTLLDKYFPNVSSNTSFDAIAFAEQWDYINRQRNYILLCIAKKRYNQRYIFPYLDPEVSEFLWSLPITDRLNCSAYYDVCFRRFSKLASMPSSRGFGGIFSRKYDNRLKRFKNGLIFWIKYNLFHGKLNPYIYTKYIPFHEYYNNSWVVIRYLRKHRDKLVFLNWDLFERDINVVKSRKIFADRRMYEVERINAFLNLGIVLLLYENIRLEIPTHMF